MMSAWSQKPLQETSSIIGHLVILVGIKTTGGSASEALTTLTVITFTEVTHKSLQRVYGSNLPG